MEIKRRDLMVIWAILESLRSAKTNIRTTYTIAKNRNLIQPEMEAIKEATNMSGSLQAYEQKRLELCNTYCEKDPNGNPIIDSGNFMFQSDKRREFEMKLVELQNSMPEAMDQARAQDIQVQALLNDPIEIPLIPFQLSQLPDDLLSVVQVEALDANKLIIE